MCGIGGVLLYPKERLPYEYEYIRALVRGIAVENEQRGTDSVGFGVFNKHSYKLLKQPIRATEMIETNVYRDFEHEISYQTSNILIHTRAATKGSFLNNDNNHPIETHRYVGIHNGTLWNDDELFEYYDLHRQGEVDSEVIFRLMDFRGNQLTPNKIAEVSEQLCGMFTFAFVPKEDSSLLYLVRNDNPVTLSHIPELNITVFASLSLFTKAAIEKANQEVGWEVVDPTTVIDCYPGEETIYAFNTSINNPLDQLTQVPTRFKSKEDKYTSHEQQWDDEAYRAFQGYASPEDFRKPERLKFSEVLDVLTSDEIEAIQRHYDAKESLMWAMGYEQGRKSLAVEIEAVRALAYQKGYEKGMDEGFELAVSTQRKKPIALPSGA